MAGDVVAEVVIDGDTQLPAGYGIWLNDDGTWYVFRGYKEHDGRTIRDELPHRYSTRWNAYRAARVDARKRQEGGGDGG